VKKIGKITRPADANIWPHEEKTAEALAFAGYDIEFVRVSNIEYRRDADVYMDGIKWEFKAPKSGLLEAIERNLVKALKQSDKIILDSRRMKRVPDEAIQRELMTKAHTNKAIVRLLFVNRKGEVIDIK
jgi:hypothetical protein